MGKPKKNIIYIQILRQRMGHTCPKVRIDTKMLKIHVAEAAVAATGEAVAKNVGIVGMVKGRITLNLEMNRVGDVGEVVETDVAGVAAALERLVLKSCLLLVNIRNVFTERSTYV